MKYFLSFNFVTDTQSGFGNSFLTLDEEIKTEEDILEVQEFIKKDVENEKKCILKQLTLMTFIKMEE